MLETNKLYLGDCFDFFSTIENNSIDMILCDLPYGTTASKWDSILSFEKLWVQYERIIKLKGAICLFGSEPFSSYLRMSNAKLFKYDWIWEKGRASGFVHAKNKPMKAHEIISVFSKGTTVHKTQSKSRMNYFPQMEKGEPYVKKINSPTTSGKLYHAVSKANLEFVGITNKNKGERYPRSVLKFSMHNVGNFHSFQKPVDLCEYLIKTYTKKNDLVLDNCAGSGTTGIACQNLNRNYILIEKDENYYKIAEQRLKENKVRIDQQLFQ